MRASRIACVRWVVFFGCIVCLMTIIALQQADDTYRSDDVDTPSGADHIIRKVRSYDDQWSNLRYLPPPQSNQTESARNGFYSSKRYLMEKLGVPASSYVQLPDSLDDYVVVTAADGKYAYVVMDAIATIQRHLAGRKIIFYDLGIENDIVESQIRHICGVEYRLFEFHKYSDHVMDLGTYAWKPLIIHEVLREHSGVFWVDSSIRFLPDASLFFPKVFRQVTLSGGILTFMTTGHSNYAANHPDLYGYLPATRESMVNTEQREANSLLIYRTRTIYTQVLRWWVLCALDEGCIAPTRVKKCQITSRSIYAGCHRFDQSTLNVLLVNWFADDVQRYITGVRILRVRRYSQGQEKLKFYEIGGNSSDCATVNAAYLFETDNHSTSDTDENL